MWLENVKQQLTYDFVLKNIEKPFDIDPALIKRVFTFLERYGYINYGIFTKLQELKEKRREKIIGKLILVQIYFKSNVQF